MDDIVIKFPVTGGGEEHGLNDAGVETFEGKIGGHYLARECAQNAGDAVAEGVETVEIKFELLGFRPDQIPCFKELRAKFESCEKFWEKNEKTVSFFSHSRKVATGKSITVLKISDTGTTGLVGGDLERTGGWYSLVRSGGVSNKEGGEGGSFGIGKFAPFAASAFRTVFYSTKTLDGAVAFQGVTRLVSHNDEAGEITQGTGYIGYHDLIPHRFQAVRIPDEIPAAFKRVETGTDIYVLAYRDADNWKADLVYSILQNFWPAIHRNSIRFVVGDTTIDRDNLKNQLEAHKHQEGFDAHVYYQALVSPLSMHFETALPTLGRVELYLLAGGEGFPKRIAMTRRNGMVIEHRLFQSRKPYSGYFVCTDETGNRLLRGMEPPAHDKWEPDRGGKTGKKALKEMADWVRACIKTLNPIPSGEALDVPDLARYLPDDPDPDAERSADEKNQVGEPAFTSKPLQEEIIPKIEQVVPVGRKTTQPDGGKEVDDGGGVGPGFGTPDPQTEGNTGKGGRSREKGGGGGTTKRPAGIIKPKLNVRSAILPSGNYKLILRSDVDYTGGVRVLSVGEDGLEETVAVDEGKVDTGQPLQIGEGGVINGVILSPNAPTVLEIKLTKTQRLALGAAPL